MFKDIAICVVPAIVVVVIAIVMVMYQMRQKPPPPPIQEQSIEYQTNIIDKLLDQDPKLREFFLEGKGDDATYAVYFGNQDVITFYRTGEREYESRDLVFVPAPRWYWGSDWKKCDDIPTYAILISDMF